MMHGLETSGCSILIGYRGLNPVDVVFSSFVCRQGNGIACILTLGNLLGLDDRF